MFHRRVLIIEDESLIALSLQEIVQALGYTVVGVAATGAEGIALATQVQPDLVLLNLRLPDRSGLEVAESLRSQAPMPILVLTGYRDPWLLEQAAACGIAQVLFKPFTIAELQRALEEIL
jgi:response regulator NasT